MRHPHPTSMEMMGDDHWDHQFDQNPTLAQNLKEELPHRFTSLQVESFHLPAPPFLSLRSGLSLREGGVSSLAPKAGQGGEDEPLRVGSRVSHITGPDKSIAQMFARGYNILYIPHCIRWISNKPVPFLAHLF